MRNKNIVALLIWLGVLSGTLVAARQQVTITAHPQAGGVTCYVNGAALSCVYIPLVTTGTELPPRPTTPPVGSATPTAIPPASITPTPTRPTSTPTPTIVIPPTATPTATAQPPLLVNADFEQDWQAGWVRFDLWPDRPLYNNERGHFESRHGGAQSLRILNEHRCFMAGVYQTVNAQQFKTYVFSVHARTWASHSSVFPSPSDLSVTDGVAVGIDPNGGTNAESSAVVWVENNSTENWRKVEVQATALASRITLFIRARLGAIPPGACQWPLSFMVAYLDDAGLRVLP